MALIREDRDTAFWSGVIEHPQVAPLVTFGHSIDLLAILDNPWVTPLRSERGGFLFVRLDGLGRVHELHTAYLPQAWGTREIVHAARQAFCAMFERGAQLIVTYEVAGNRRSQPPKTFRFEPCGDFAPAPDFPHLLRTWALTKAAWEGSPARVRM